MISSIPKLTRNDRVIVKFMIGMIITIIIGIIQEVDNGRWLIGNNSIISTIVANRLVDTLADIDDDRIIFTLFSGSG